MFKQKICFFVTEFYGYPDDLPGLSDLLILHLQETMGGNIQNTVKSLRIYQ